MVFITGFSGRFPSSSSVSDFWNNLCSGVDLVTNCNDRYPEGYHGLPNRTAQIQTIKKFDAMFFGVSSAQASCLDPQIRLLLESVYEAIVDAGYSMTDLAGSSTGVYVGGCFSDLHKAMLSDLRVISGYENTGCSHSMFANRVSFYFDFKGPSYTVDTACSSSLVALDQAVRDIRSGRVTRAIVGGVSIVTDPAVSKSFHMYNMLSPNGKCHSFDDRANGYVRADAIGAVLLEAESMCGGIGIMRVLGTGCNSDGWKAKGITFPSSDQQIALCKSVCEEYDIDPKKVEYVEAHGTGTTAGDGQELRAIDTVYGGHAYIGSIKSNMGHSEGASGIMSLIKVLGILTDKKIPTNLHYVSSGHVPIVSKRLTVVTETRDFEENAGGIIAINNFGFGGTNASTIGVAGGLPLNTDESKTRFIFGRTEAALEQYHATGDLNAASWNKLLPSSVMNNKFPFRGIVDEENALNVQEIVSTKPNVAFCYAGQGCQWAGMAADLWAQDEYFRSIVTDACVGLPVDCEELFATGEKWMDKKWSGLGITLVQVGLTAMLNKAGIVPDFLFGHSVGEVACGYGDGCTSAREAARIAYLRCQLSEKIEADGLMMACGLTFNQAEKMILSFPDTVIACYNSPDGVTLSGATDEIREIVQKCEAQGVFAKIVPTDGVAYHSTFFKKNANKIQDILVGAITDVPKVPRSSRWLSTSIMEDVTLYSDAIYHTGNITGMVNFAPVVASLPAGTIVLEIGPHALLKSILKRGNKDVIVIPTMIKKESGVACMKRCIDAVWLSGAHFKFPRAAYVVPLKNRVQVLWDHENDWRAASYKDFQKSRSTTVSYDLAGKDAYLMDHVIDGRPLFPACGHVVTAWQAYGTKNVHFKNVKILQAIIMDGISISFNVTAEEKGFTISYDGSLVASGIVSADPLVGPTFKSERSYNEEDYIGRLPIYSTFARHSYEYKTEFQLINKRSVDGLEYHFSPTKYWVTYLDNILQASLKDPNGLNLPTEIGAVSIRCEHVKDAPNVIMCNPKLHAMGNAMVSVRDMKTTVSRKMHKAAHIKGVDFIPYGEHVVSATQQYVNYIEYHLLTRFWALHTVHAHQYSFLRQTAKLLKSINATESDVVIPQDLVKAQFTNDEKSLRAPFFAMLEHVYSYGNLLSSGLADAIATAPTRDATFGTDPFVSALPGSLEIAVQVIRENLPRPFSVLEFGGAHTGGFTKSIFPLVEADMSSYSVSFPANEKCPTVAFPSISVSKHDWAEGTPLSTPVDVIVASHVLHTVSNIGSALDAIYASLQEGSDGGYLLIHEFCSHLPLLLWGLTDAAFEANEKRDFGMWMSKENWLNVLKEHGFESVVWFVDESSSQLLVLAKKLPDESILVEERVIVNRQGIEDGDASLLMETDDYGNYGLVRSIRKEPGYSNIRIAYKDTNHEVKTSLPIAAVVNGKLGGFHEVEFRGSKPENRAFHVEVTNPGDMTSLCWVENYRPPNCDVVFCGINFKDVMLSYGKLVSEGSVKIGLEFTGFRNGKPVMGISSGCMATKLYAHDHLVWDIPTRLGLDQACTVPVVYATVYYALICKANIQPGQTVLIHSIAGGVGQSAFHVCSFRGARIICTCSKDKRDWVHNELGVPYNHILDSHAVTFRDDVLELTDGLGVQVVLNSLSDVKLQAGLSCVASYGHFCEIGKYDIQQDTPIGLGVFERNVSFHGIDLSDMFDKPVVWQPIRDLVSQGLLSGEIKPLCTTIFNEVEPALRCISAGKHIGKVLVRVSLPPSVALTAKPYYLTKGTHLVIGGLGGFGLELVGFLRARGAEKIVVVSRGNPKAFQYHILGDSEVDHSNLVDPEQCDALLENLGDSLVGIWHLGMVLNDCLYDNMTDTAWDQTVNVKAVMTRNLDASARKYCPSLKEFVMWSSVSSLFGNPGQTNYAYANSVMECVCRSRKADGLCGLAINWGFIGNVGVMMEKGANVSLGFTPQHIDSCLESLNVALYCEHAVVTSYIRKVQSSESSGAVTVTLPQRVAHILGVDAGKIKDSDTLASLGMDSLQSVEVTNVFKAAGVAKKIVDLRSTSWAQVTQLED